MGVFAADGGPVYARLTVFPSETVRRGSRVDSTGCAAAEPFALRVLGDMMEPEFEHGCIIIVDPEGLVKDGCFVVANHDNEFYFRQLVIEGDRYLLKCLNHAYDEVVEIAGLSAINGVIAQKAGTRRKDRKRYD